MFNFLSARTNILEATWLFVKSLTVSVSFSSLKKEIEEHPFYPSLLSISEVLTNFGVKNVTAKFDVNKIPDLPTPFLIQIRGNDNDDNFFSIVRRSDKDAVEYYNPQSRKWEIEERSVFIAQCTGIVLIAKLDENSGDKKYSDEIRKEKRTSYYRYFLAFVLPAFLLVQSIIGFVHYGNSIILPLFFSVLYLIGSLLCLLIIWQDIDHHNPATQMICASGKKINCNAVLDSYGAKIFGINWSIIGFSYFSGGLIYIIISGFYDLQPFCVLWAGNLLTTFYILYSVFYQWRIAKTWCILCLSVLIVLLLITGVGFVGGWHYYLNLSFHVIIQLLVCFVILFIGGTIIYSVLIKAKHDMNWKLEFQRSKRNPEILKRSLIYQKAITVKPDGLGIILGNASSSNKIIKVCNPYCNPCALVHDSIKELLNNSDDLSVQIIFTATNENNDLRAFPVRHLLALYEKGEVDIEDALDDWYHLQNKDYQAFASKYPMDNDLLSHQNIKIERMRKWSDEMTVSFTPTFFINGYQLPSNYSVDDLKYCFLE